MTRYSLVQSVSVPGSPSPLRPTKLPNLAIIRITSSSEADIGAAAVDDTGPSRRAGQGLGVAPLDHRPHILEDHIAAGALCRAMADLLANNFVVVRR
jgi:hypothetical protein